jgi:Holliday junction DNA helicase RuvA
MIAYLKGIIKNKDSNSVILDVAGVGYRVFLPMPDLAKIGQVGQPAEVLIHTHVREDEISLYGFLAPEELQMFEKLLTISGIGPKAALSVLSASSIEQLQTAIMSGSTDVLTKISGIGKKTAERIVLELRGKVSDVLDSGRSGGSGDSELYDALSALGYDSSEIRSVLKTMPAGLSTITEKISWALKSMGRVRGFSPKND